MTALAVPTTSATLVCATTAGLVCQSATTGVGAEEAKTGPHQAEITVESISPELVDLIGGGGRTRTYDLRIMRPSL